MYNKFRSAKLVTFITNTPTTRCRPSDTLPHAIKDLPSTQLFYYGNLKKIPKRVLILIALLAGLGLLNMYSIASSINAVYFIKFLFFWSIAVIPFVFSVIINIRYLVKFAYWFYAISIVSLLVVLVIGSSTMGAKRWIDIGFMKIQPSEFAKIAIIFALAKYHHFVKDFNISKIRHSIIAFGICAIPVGLTVIQPDLGSGLIMVFLAVMIVFVSGIKWRWVIFVGLGFVCIMPVIWSQLHDYQKNRVIIFLEPEKDPYGAGYNVIQSKIAIGSGGLFGKGYLDNNQSALKFLPENQTDFALTVFAEEFGFVGCLTLLCIFANLIMYGLLVATKVRSHFCRIVAFGITSMMFLHVAINMSMVMGLLPVVGIPLPFISYGGSALMLCTISLGILANLDIHRDLIIHASKKTYMLK